MPQIKLSSEQQKKLAEVEAFDREQAFEAGFAKAAFDLGLDENQFKSFYEVGCKKMAASQGTE